MKHKPLSEKNMIKEFSEEDYHSDWFVCTMSDFRKAVRGFLKDYRDEYCPVKSCKYCECEDHCTGYNLMMKWFGEDKMMKMLIETHGIENLKSFEKSCKKIGKVIKEQHKETKP